MSKVGVLCVLTVLWIFGCGVEETPAPLMPKAEAALSTAGTPPTRMLITGVPRYRQDIITNASPDLFNPMYSGVEVWAGCGPVAGLMLLSYYDRRYGYQQLVPSDQEKFEGMPEDLIRTLRFLMQTQVVPHSLAGLTLPPNFRYGLEAYVNLFYSANVYTVGTSDIGVSLKDVFDESVRLIRANKPHVILFDANASWLPTPTHYGVVVGYSTEDSRTELICNLGWGADFHIVDCSDSGIRPVRLYWLAIESSPDGPQDGHSIGPKTDYDEWATVLGKRRLRPREIYKHLSSTSCVGWSNATRTDMFVAGSGELPEISVNEWYY